MPITIRSLQPEDIQLLAAAFAAIGWNKPAAQYEQYLAEQQAGHRTVLVAFQNGSFAGYLTINWYSDYAPFRDQHIPEIQDFNVLPHLRRRGIGTRLMEEAEDLVADRSRIVGIGVGLYADYGAAQRLYVRRGFVPDGRGIAVAHQSVAPGQQVIVDDDLVLYLTKQV